MAGGTDGQRARRLSDEEKAHLKKYGRLKKTVGVKKEKKYFDSADWQMSGGQKGGGKLGPGMKKPPLPAGLKNSGPADE